MTMIALLGFVATPAVSLWPVDGSPVPLDAGLFQPQPKLAGAPVASCGGVSPQQVYCSFNIPSWQCVQKVCTPNVRPGAGFTGSIVSKIWGVDANGQGKAVGYGCPYTAGSRTTVGGVVSGECWVDSSPGCEVQCVLRPYADCGCFRLVGYALPPRMSSNALGLWSALAEVS